MSLINSGFLRGIGVGLIVSGLLVNFSGSSSEDAKVVAQQQVVPQEKTQQTLPQPQSTRTKPTQPLFKTKTKAKIQTQPITQAQPKAESGQPGETTLRIPGGSGSEEIAALLYDQGLITSKQGFAALSAKMKADTRFKAGKFSIPSGASDKEIIVILTGK